MLLSDKKVLVTGSNGLLGKYLVKALEKEGCTVVPFDKAEGDVRDWECVKKIEDVDIICHLAAIPSVAYSFENPKEVFDVNALGTLNFLELARLKKVKRFVFISSYLYGNPESLPIGEDHTLRPGNPYAYSKLAAEKFCESYNQSFELPVTILRPFNIYGPEQPSNFVIPTILTQIGKGKIVMKDLEPKRDYIYITDVISAIVKSLKADVKGYEVFNLGTGKSHSVKELLEIMMKVVGKDVPVEDLKQRRPNEIMDCKADIAKAKKVFGWESEVSLEEGISNIVSE